MRSVSYTTAVLVIWCSGGASAQEASVRPGVNDPFRDPNVGEFQERFEREGRDAFDRRFAIVEACQLRPGMVVADVGAGTGLFTRLFSPRVGPGGRVIGVDIAPKFVEHIERTAREQQFSNISGVVCQPDRVELPPASVDLVFICDTYHHFEFPQRTVQSLHRALKPDGQLVLIDFQRVEGVSSEWVLNHVRAGQEVFAREICAVGFRQVDERPKLLKESYFVRFAKTESPRVP